MNNPSPSGTAPFVLSILDNAFTGVGHPVEETFHEMISLAQLADRRGYQRFWMSEHHAMPGAAVSSPQLMVARLTGETERIRLGVGGIMLPNHVPLVVAEQIGMLDALAPGRIDLGLGRAPGTDGATAAALRRHHTANDEFPEQIDELLGFLGNDFPPDHPYRNVPAVPGPWQAEQNRVPRSETSADIWVLGSSTYSAHVAARLGRPYAFALQFGSADILNAMRIYRENFRPSSFLAEPYSLVSIGAIADENPAEARRQSTSTAMAMLRMFQRKPFALLPPEEVEAFQANVQERQIIEEYTDRTLHGTAGQVAAGLEELQAQTGVDEVMLVVSGYSRRAQSRTVELIADHYGMPTH
ncbi:MULTISPECIES: LLM class flavin-dependent oxidoreductase [unclassified Cryobacterium]|uniref:LLM class flavin-dependent oxidoreductase n=1 Tax=unclassified Cryobacterium TaxID=2649013 RepID=UPI00106C1881|nr:MULTISPECIES: LLM class flavin-dependent oxidoreductase [unclassified Cryobacterium]TFC57489.1 LLM class flavin-dependent oxidoreductase [Cryobacterium sp. TMB1-7]TFC90012.1 LLM class flavin-dependent oxidoreductase [Cryobacterium sp. TMT4-31]